MSRTLDPTDSDGDEGYAKSLSNRQIRMIAIGGAIGVGLFLGSGGRLAAAGPGLVVSYVVCGVAAFFVMRALGELVLHRPTAGSFVVYAREFIGPWAGFASGWLYWLNWAMTGVAETTAVGIYVHRWLPGVPQWMVALAALVFLLTVNLLSVRLFGELEFWFSVIKVLAIVTFLFVGLALVLTGAGIGREHAGPANLTSHGGLLPHGLPVVLMSLQAVVFAYSGIEMVGIAAGEAHHPRIVMPRAINGVIWRICVFYIGSVVLLTLLLPWNAYRAGESPFVTVFSRLGVPFAGDAMNAVVLTAALSSCNSGLYATGRVLRALAARREAPGFVGRMNDRHVPYGGILFTACVLTLGVGLNYAVPQMAFDIATSVSSLGVVAVWVTLVWCQLRLRAAAGRGQLSPPGVPHARLPGDELAHPGLPRRRGRPDALRRRGGPDRVLVPARAGGRAVRRLACRTPAARLRRGHARDRSRSSDACRPASMTAVMMRAMRSAPSRGARAAIAATIRCSRPGSRPAKPPTGLSRWTRPASSARRSSRVARAASTRSIAARASSTAAGTSSPSSGASSAAHARAAATCFASASAPRTRPRAPADSAAMPCAGSPDTSASTGRWRAAARTRDRSITGYGRWVRVPGSYRTTSSLPSAAQCSAADSHSSRVASGARRTTTGRPILAAARSSARSRGHSTTTPSACRSIAGRSAAEDGSTSSVPS